MKDAYAWNRAINMMNEIHQRMGLTWVYQMRLERLAVDNIAQKHIEEAIEFGKSLAAQPAPQQEQGWREEAAKWLRRKADEQQKVNDAYPSHVECYPAWKNKVRDLNWLADDLDRESSEPPFGLEPWQAQPVAQVNQMLTDEQIEAIQICRLAKIVSVSRVQRVLGIGYNHAQKLCESIIASGQVNGLIVAPSLAAIAAAQEGK
jgi:hypothetical protein